MTSAVYPRFLGVDGSGDFVWEMESGRWTWGDDPHDANGKTRTFEPERYIEKYGRPIGLTETIDRKAEADEDPAEVAKRYARPTLLAEGKEAASLALYSLLVNLDGWIEGQHSNHEASGHRGENRGEECWRLWAPADFRSMVNDVARELGISEFPKPESPKEDSFR